jgi:hypothetical protein
MEAVDKKGFPLEFNNESKIDNKTITKKSDYHIYTLNGQRINNTSQLKHGIYIINKKKVIF